MPNSEIIEALTKNLFDLNPFQFEIVSGLWGNQNLMNQISKFVEIDYLIISDCFYDKKYFPHLLATISTILKKYTSIDKALCVYHHRK